MDEAFWHRPFERAFIPDLVIGRAAFGFAREGIRQGPGLNHIGRTFTWVGHQQQDKSCRHHRTILFPSGKDFDLCHALST